MGDSKGNFLWPAVDTVEAAKKLTHYGVGAALFSAIVTALAVAWAIGAKQKAFGFVDPFALLDVILFLAVAFGIYKGSRVAAVGGLGLFLVEKASQIATTGTLPGPWMAFVLILCYVYAIRGVYALRRLNEQPSEG